MKKVVVTCGDPAGVGPEILLRWARERPELASSVALAGPRTWLERMAELGEFERHEVGPASFSARSGEPSVEGAKLAWEAMELAAQGCVAGDFRAVATGPVSKEWMGRAGFSFPGQTEFFAGRWGGEPVMGFWGRRLNVALATWHIPLAEVPGALDEEAIGRAVRAAVILAGYHGITDPRIGVCGLNPHAGEAGILGGQEKEWIDPFLGGLKEEVPWLSGTLPADTLFWRALQGEFDAVVALYHDQGLGPLKTVEFEGAVNVTLGLPWLRTSPDHGTGFDLAGRGKASAASFHRAIDLALRFG